MEYVKVNSNTTQPKDLENSFVRNKESLQQDKSDQSHSLAQNSFSPNSSLATEVALIVPKDNFALEDELVLQLKQVCCRNGKELDPMHSAPILHEMARVYHKRSPDHFSLIRSAALYNAAIARSPDNKGEIEKDLRQFCNNLLVEAGATNKNADLIHKSIQVKQSVIKMRDQVEVKLKEIESIPDDVKKADLTKLEQEKSHKMKGLQDDITNNYTDIMADIGSYCENVMGKPSCNFALAGMGSLARKEITPFSDFENILLLENSASKQENFEEILHYFRWYSVIFQIILINLQETIIPSVAIPSLNDESSKHGDWFYDAFTTRGVSFDGMMPHACKFPLGRQFTKNKPWKTELIKTVDDMLKYLSSDASLKNGYHLSDILTRTCFVYRDKNVYDEFEKGVFEQIENSAKEGKIVKEVKEQILDDLGKFAIRPTFSELKAKEKLNVKQVAYRSTTLFITALGRICNIRASSCFEIVASLAQKQEISEYAEHKLNYAVALACEIRLRWYHKNKKQCDELVNDARHKSSAMNNLLGIVGKNSTISYFNIAYALQCDVSKRLHMKDSCFNLGSNHHALNFGPCFEDQDHLQFFPAQQKNIDNFSKNSFNFDECLKRMETKATDSTPHLKADEDSSQLESTSFNFCCNAQECLQNKGKAVYVKKSCRKCPHKHPSKTLSQKLLLARNYFQIGCSLAAVDRTKTREYFENSKGLSEQVLKQATADKDNAGALRLIGQCLLHLQKSEEALACFEKLLKMRNEMSESLDKGNDIADILHWIGLCLVTLMKPEKAVTYFKRSLEVKEKASSNFCGSLEVAVTLHWLGRCCLSLRRGNEALEYLLKSLQIKQKNSDCTFITSSEKDIAMAMFWVGRCFFFINNPHAAISYFKRSLQIQENTFVDVTQQEELVPTLYWTGRCLLTLNAADKALECLKKTLFLVEKKSVDVSCDKSIATLLNWIGQCFMKKNNTDEAMIHFNKALRIQETVSVDTDVDGDVANTLHWIERCMKLNVTR